MKFSAAVVLLAVSGQFVAGFSPLLQIPSRTSTTGASRHFTSTTRIYSQWDDEEDETKSATSFEDAGVQLKEDDDQKAMDAAPDYDANPAYKKEDISRFREAIKKRADSLGIEEAKMTKELIRAKEEQARNGGNPGDVTDQTLFSGDTTEQMLDLSQISQTAPRGESDLPSILYDVEDEMSDEEMKEADPDGQLSIQEWATKELALTEWPTPVGALKEVLILVGSVVFTTLLVVYWDAFLRETYTNLGFLPRPEDIGQGTENLVLPDGWTDGMSEDDFMKYQDEVGKAASSISSAASDAFTKP